MVKYSTKTFAYPFIECAVSFLIIAWLIYLKLPCIDLLGIHLEFLPSYWTTTKNQGILFFSIMISKEGEVYWLIYRTLVYFCKDISEGLALLRFVASKKNSCTKWSGYWNDGQPRSNGGSHISVIHEWSNIGCRFQAKTKIECIGK